MSAPNSHPPLFRPAAFLTGVALGLLALAFAGRFVTTWDWHQGFVRFHPGITSESQYQPTLAEMRAIVRARCRPDQVLVIVGGNSIFQGVGQPVEKLWTRRLQELLGERYVVINFALRGSSPTDGGALAAESLRDEYPRLIYLANLLPFGTASAAGNLEYRFMLFDAMYKGWLLPHPPRRDVIVDNLRSPQIYPGLAEVRLGGYLDGWLRFRDLWNWWSFTKFFTFPTPTTPTLQGAFRPRELAMDREPDFETMPFRERFAERFWAAEMAITRATSGTFYQLDAAGKWEYQAGAVQSSLATSRLAFPDAVKARTLIVFSRNSPFYTQRLTDAERVRDELAYRDSVREFQALGYAATEYGPDFTTADFGDRTHLTAQGGRKLAERLAPEIRQLAGKLNYLSVSP